MRILIIICILLLPIQATDTPPTGTLEYWQRERIKQLTDNAKKLYIINANIQYLQ